MLGQHSSQELKTLIQQLHKEGKEKGDEIYVKRQNNLFRAQIKRTTRQTIVQPTTNASVLPSAPELKSGISLKKYRTAQRNCVSFFLIWISQSYC